ncbi:SctK family type III secretion system sorting platform protein [Endozoicomonas sp. GU-1]|uniref:SctK family type III secretion system sorting platform protein n=1 Tax=Endozoicomonas TaxID=305899 RepID=UPI0022B45760|nr:SctK family type III secretion system sorting platform protein [Endozoicomonas sp. GU-1]WBA83008.1 SctK family type III secretion system sorting platform protein [Endozoicomonas sp. GU-1]WBA85930.1 SctK family type III secretion system sorting platform protein [Endozoicomonas sp. GU-1]
MNSNNVFQEHNGTSLFNHVVEFNFFPVRYVHASWLKSDKHFKLLKSLQTSEPAQFSLSNYLLSKFGIAKQFDYDFDRPDKRIVFASAEEIEQLALYIGLILNEATVRSVIRRDERKALEKCLGEEAYRFTVKKAQFISRASEKNGPGVLIDWKHLDRFKAFLELNGRQVIATAFSDLPGAFRQRLILKMPSSWKKTLSSPGAGGLDKAQCVKLLVKTHKEVNRQWRHLLS